MEYNKIGYMEYSNAFVRGYNENVYNDGENKLDVKDVDFSSMESIGYYDGNSYAEYVKDTFQVMSITQEQIIAEIDKRHTWAMERCIKEETSKGLR